MALTVIVFEDLDRFNVSRIFERLHEVNTLVNIQLKKENKDKYKPLRFFYLLRDDIFVSKDRTKFFDYIIPTIPVVDNSNSYEQFRKHLRQGNILERFEQSFLQTISLYVDDMRILKNIYNEFMVYINKLNNTELNYDKMLAMIVYKNLFPRDFSDLQLGKGYVFNILNQRNRLTEEALMQANENKKKLNDRIARMEREILKDEQELTDVYDAKSSRLTEKYRFSNEQVKWKEIVSQNNKEKEERRQIIEDKANRRRGILENERITLEREISSIANRSLKDLITRDNQDNIFAVTYMSEMGKENKFEDIRDGAYFELLKILIRDGYIDEMTYSDYMTYFYEDSMRASDKKFLQRIKENRGADYEYPINDHEKVIASPIFEMAGCGQEEVLNFDIFEHLLMIDDKEDYREYLRKFIEQLMETKNYNFISSFYDTKRAREQFVSRMNKQWPGFFGLARYEHALTPQQLKDYSVDTMYYCDDSVIQSIDNELYLVDIGMESDREPIYESEIKPLSSYISECPDYLAIEQPDLEKLISGFLLIDVSFETIDYDSANKELFERVYQENLYGFTFENIGLMLRTQYGIRYDHDIIQKNYTLVQSKPKSPLAGYVNLNISLYVEIIIRNCSDRITDTEEVAICLLNNEKIDIKKRRKYLELLSTPIFKIDKIASDLWAETINWGRLLFSEENLIIYFMTYGLDSTLVKYINNDAPANLFLASVMDDFGSEVSERLFREVALCNEIQTGKYKKMLLDLGLDFDDFEVDDISDDKFKVIIEENILKMNAESLNFVREKYRGHLLTFIKQNLDEYLVLQSEETFELREALEIINGDISDEKKLSLLELADAPISIVGKGYSDEVNSYILNHNVNDEEVPLLYASYSEYGELTQEIILAFALTDVAEILRNSMKIDTALLSALIQNEAVGSEDKVNLFINKLPDLDERLCKVYLNELGFSVLKSIFTKRGERKKYEVTPELTMILRAFKTHGWITDFYLDEDDHNKYIVLKN